MAQKQKNLARPSRRRRVRVKISGTSKRPRLFVFKSNKHIYAGLADDVDGKVLIAISDRKLKEGNNNTIKTAKKLGEELAKLSLKGGYKDVVFDRSGYKYHGKVKALADGAREGGLKF